MASQAMALENTYSTKTLIGNWQENRDLFGNKYAPADKTNNNRPVTSYNIMTSNVKQPAKEFRNIQSAGFSRNHYNNQNFANAGKSWSSLALESKGPKSDNRFISTAGKNFDNPGTGNQQTKNPGVSYNNRTWKLIKGHWLPESIDTAVKKEPTRFGLIEAKEAEWAEIDAQQLFNRNKSVYKSSFRDDNKCWKDFPERITKTTLKRSTQMYPINKENSNFVLRGSRLVNVIPDIVSW